MSRAATATAQHEGAGAEQATGERSRGRTTAAQREELVGESNQVETSKEESQNTNPRREEAAKGFRGLGF